MLNPTNPTQHSTPSRIACDIRVKSGDLAPKGKGALTIGVMPDGKVSLSATLPNASGMSEPFDLTSLDRLELVSVRKGLYQGKQWIGPAVVTTAGLIGIPALFEYTTLLDRVAAPIFFGLAIGGPYTAGVYTGSKLNNIARFVAITSDGRHCVGEMPEAAFRFVQGVKASENLHVADAVADSATNPENIETDPVPA